MKEQSVIEWDKGASTSSDSDNSFTFNKFVNILGVKSFLAAIQSVHLNVGAAILILNWIKIKVTEE
jgi:hypothetical protein